MENSRKVYSNVSTRKFPFNSIPRNFTSKSVNNLFTKYCLKHEKEWFIIFETRGSNTTTMILQQIHWMHEDDTDVHDVNANSASSEWFRIRGNSQGILRAHWQRKFKNSFLEYKFLIINVINTLVIKFFFFC